MYQSQLTYIERLVIKKRNKMAHMFNAESHLICNLCTSVADALKEGDMYTL